MTPFLRYRIYTIFTLSGFTSLVYEILWAKQLSLVFGTSIVAVSIVAATFMGGLALGSILFGRYIDRHQDYMRVYAILELGIALCALCFPIGLELIRNGYIDFSQAFTNSPLYAHGLQFIQTTVLLILPAALMGGTFPAICRQFARDKCGGQIGRLYAFNTVGATLGAFACGYLLIPSFGIHGTNLLAITFNMVVVIGAWSIGGQLVSGNTPPTLKSTLHIQHWQQKLVLISIALIGFFSLAYEILWTRVFLLFLGNTSYAFSLILSCFLVGIALGGWQYARLTRPQMDEEKIFLLFTALMGFSVLLTAPFYDQLAYIFQASHEIAGDRWWLLSLHNWLIVFAILCLPTICSGALLPASVALLNPGRLHTGSGVGMVVSHNTIGAVFGSLVAGFALVPAFGLQNSFRLLAIGNLLMAGILMIFFRSRLRGNLATAATLALGIFITALPLDWDEALMNSGVYCYAAKYAAMGGIDEILAQERILETIEGRDTTVAVHESLDGRFRIFTVNGKTDGGTGSDMATQILVGHLPMLMHPAPEETLVIGLGTGITLKGLSHYVAERVDCVEISSEVVAAERYFSDFNGQALSDPKVRLLVNDGRNHLFANERLYDVIISEPSNPWQSGNANLFTYEFYQLAKSRLTDSGVFSQWIGLYDITPENLKIAINTLLNVFPHVQAFQAGSDLILLATTTPRSFDYQRLQSMLAQPSLQRVFAPLGIHSPGDIIARHYLYGSKSLERFVAGATINSDDRPILEYSAHHNLGEATLGELQRKNVEALQTARARENLPLALPLENRIEVAAALTDLGMAFRRVGAQPESEFFLTRAQEVATP